MLNSEYRKQLPGYNAQLKAGTPRKNTIKKGDKLHAIFGIRRANGFTLVRQTAGKMVEHVQIRDGGRVSIIGRHVKLTNAIKAAYLASGRTQHEYASGYMLEA